MPRLSKTLLIFALLLAGLAGVVLWEAGNAIPQPGQVVASGTVRVGGPFRLTDQNGKARANAEFRGKYVLVYFGYTNCPDVCPVTLNVIGDALKKLGTVSRRIVPLFITLDPTHDTPEILKAYLRNFDQGILGLTGSEGAIKSVAREYRVYVSKRSLANGAYSLDHSNTLYLMGPDGQFVTLYDETIGPDALAADLRKHIDG